MPDLQLNTAAFAKFNCLTRKNLPLIYTGAFTPSLVQIYSEFFMVKNFDFKEKNFCFLDATNCRLCYASPFSISAVVIPSCQFL